MKVGMEANWLSSWNVAALDTKIDYEYIGTEHFHCVEYRQTIDLFVEIKQHVFCIAFFELSTFIITLFRKITRPVKNYIMRSLMICKSRRMRWAGHVAHRGKGEVYTGLWWGNLREKNHLEGPGVDGRILLRWISRRWNVGLLTWSSWLRIRTIGGDLWMR